MIPFLMVDDVIERALLLIRQHPLFIDPIVVGPTGLPLRINKLRDFDGLDTNTTGITLSIFPYGYHGTSNETTSSKNVAMSFEDYNVGSSDVGFDKATLNLVVQLKLVGYEKDSEIAVPAPNTVVIERSAKERALYRWMTILRAILLTKPVENLSGLVQNSTVKQIAYQTTTWDASPGSPKGGQNAVFHTANLMWQIYLNSPRNYTLLPSQITLPNSSTGPSWIYIGKRNLDCMLMYWDSVSKVITTLAGMPVTTTPQGLTVIWNPTLKQFETPAYPGVALTAAQLIDPRTVGPVTWIDTSVIWMGTFQNLPLFWNTVTNQFEQCNGTIITQLTNGTLLCYQASTDPTLPGIVINCTTGLPVPDSTEFQGIHASNMSIYDANSLVLRDTFRL